VDWVESNKFKAAHWLELHCIHVTPHSIG